MPTAGADPLGSVADEAARLLAALRTASAPVAAGDGAQDGPEEAPRVDAPHDRGDRDDRDGPEHVPTGHASHDDPEPGHSDDGAPGQDGCGWCPVCAAARVLRPENVDAVADVLMLGADGLRALATTLRSRGTSNPASNPAQETPATTPSPDTAATPPATTPATNRDDRGDQS